MPVVQTMNHSERKYTVRSLCGLFGISRQGYYKHQDQKSEMDILSSSVVLYCKAVREHSILPKAGCRELCELCRKHFREKFTMGRDQFYNLLRSNDLMLRKRRYRPRTTDSNHNYKLCKDLLNTTPKLRPSRKGELVVSDITYVYVKEEFAYLSLITDAFSRYVVGYSLSRTLERNGPLKALEDAIKLYSSYGIETKGLIHHSDRGVQYASHEYTDMLKANGIRISMTQTGNPLHNALANRMNNTLKNSWLFNDGELSFEQAETAIAQAIKMYNTARPHSSLGMRTPMDLLTGVNQNPLI